MEQSEQSCFWEANSHSASQEILRLLWNPKNHYRVHKSPPLVRILSHMHSVHTFPSYFSNIRFNITFPSTHMPSSRSSNIPFLQGTCNLTVHSIYVTFVGHNLKVSHCRHVCKSGLVNSISYIICRCGCYAPIPCFTVLAPVVRHLIKTEI
jgi:hypothetical protein